MERREQIWPPHEEYLGYYPHYLYVNTKYIDVHVSNIWSFLPKYSQSYKHKCNKENK